MATARNRSELNEAMKRGESTIEITGDLAKKVIRLKATGAVAWAIAIGAIGVAVVAAAAFLPASVATGGAAAPIDGAIVVAAMTPAVTVLGGEVAMLALGLATAAGGVGALTRLRSGYKIIDQSTNHVVLSKL